ncbi:RHS repeat-associated core domain-containing protein [Streptomyces sp. FH025]|uniref:RHS repeat-associated core domain-containing protein n=1 Tax=Streptomyces sp. FH025 TaxID=2815937 RepID=UPI001A9E0EA8|nr:RHS repeat-associated core domain-containing protein [Streptomyces sp. FH025]MBO1417463.1 RHS repeat-associated core domain-containing protein [Streptomyces sp. FH025]
MRAFARQRTDSRRRLIAIGVSLAVSVSVIQGTEWVFAPHPAAAATVPPSVPSVTGLSPWSLNAYNQVGYTTSTTPTLRAVATADAGTYQAQFELTPDPAVNDTTYSYTGLSGRTASGAVALLTLPTANGLPDGKHLRLRVRAYDGTNYGDWSGYTAYTVDTNRPAAPTISCAGVPAGDWTASVPDGTQCTLSTTAGDGQGYAWGMDDSSASQRVSDTSGSGTGKPLTITIGAGTGWHTLYARTIDAAGNESVDTTGYSFGVGAGRAALLTPLGGERTAGRLSLSAVGATDYTGVTYQYRLGETDSWKDVPAANVTRASDGSALSWPLAVSGGTSAALTWKATDTLAADSPVDVQAKFTKADGTTGYTQVSTVTLDRVAGTAPAREIGPGNVNPLTGDFTLNASDASFFGLSVSRTASSRQPDAGSTRAGQAAIFGPQWSSGVRAELTGTDWVAVEQTSATSVAVVTEAGRRIGFTAVSGGGWQAEPGVTNLTLTGSPTGSFTLKDTDGRTVTFAKIDPAATTWAFASSFLATANSTTTVVSEKVTVNGKVLARPKYVVAPTSAVTAATCATTPSTKGCRVLEFGYATATTATASTSGDFAGQVNRINLWATAPGAASSTSTTVAAYDYDASGRLRDAWDPRLSSPLKTSYGYDTAGRVTGLTPPGELPWTMSYGKVGSSSVAGDGMLLNVSRANLAAGSASTTDGTNAVTTVVYNVPISGSNAPYQLAASDVRSWHQAVAPTDATAVFPADQVPASNDGSALSATSYGRATVQYVDASGRDVNVAQPGGYIGTTQYDRFGNTTRSLSPANRAVALGLTDADKATQADLGIASLSSADRAEELENYSYWSGDGARELETFGPLHRLDLVSDFVSGTTVLMKTGTSVTGRSWAVKEYDTGRPTDGTAVVSNKPTIVTSGLRVRGYDSLLTNKRVTETQYDWAKGVPTLNIQDGSGVALSYGTGYDAQGRVVSQDLPGANGAGAGSRVTVYWQGDGTGWCKGRPEWADQVCWTGPAGSVTGGGTNPTQTPDIYYEYNRYGQVAETDETGGSSYRNTFLGYDSAGRLVSTHMTGNLGQPIPDVTTTYGSTDGRITSTSSTGGGTVSRTYDKLGRVISYTDADGATTTTGYDQLGRMTTVSDSVPSTTTYGYDSATEPRGLPTKIVDSVAGTFTATYAANGTVATEHLPGGYTLSQSQDTAGLTVNRTYTKDADGSTVMSDSVTRSVFDQVTTHANSATLNSQKYSYDKAGRLVETQDTAAGVCTDRAYTLDRHSNRTALTTTTGTGGAPCATTGGTTVNHSYDTADRIVDAGYAYDDLGRTTAMPGTAVGYYWNDLVYQQVSGLQRQTWQLDSALRRRSFTTESNATGSWVQTGAKVNHYSCDCDNPRWITENASGAVTRNVIGLAGGMAATTSKTGDTVLMLTNIHGDTNLMLPLDTTKSPTLVDSDEFGRPKATGSAAARYGWLGGYQRSAETTNGLVLMGVRLYNPDSGRFLSIDPVYGGNANPYDYVYGDPVNMLDLSGKFRWEAHWYGAVLRLTKWENKMIAENGWFVSGFIGLVKNLGPYGRAIAIALLGLSWAAQLAQYWGRCLQLRAWGYAPWATSWWVGGCA